MIMKNRPPAITSRFDNLPEIYKQEFCRLFDVHISNIYIFLNRSRIMAGSRNVAGMDFDKAISIISNFEREIKINKILE